MKIYVRYLSSVYLKYFFIVFFALELFYVGVDFLVNLKDIPQSANMAILYVGLTALIAVNYVLPLSLVFAFIISTFNMIRSNELVSFYALGISKNRLIAPIFFIALGISFVYICLNSTPFAYASEYQNNIENYNNLGRISTGMFVKYENKYIYINSLNPSANYAENLTILHKNGNQLESYEKVKNANYSSDEWTLNEIQKTVFPLNLSLGGTGYRDEKEVSRSDLIGFDPKAVEQVYESSNVYSIKDAISSLKTFKNQDINVNGIKSTLYNLVFFPLFAPFMILILYYYLPIIARFFNLALISFGFIIITLGIWGVLFLLVRFSSNGVIYPEFGIITPIVLLGGYGLYLVVKNKN
ncbi:MAG: LptF/LptG family permease [Campylobacter sp.]|nr:LptF/LptG family permease [Campylobacter sp.]